MVVTKEEVENAYQEAMLNMATLNRTGNPKYQQDGSHTDVY